MQSKLPPRDKIRFFKPTLEGSGLNPDTWPEIEVEEYPPLEEARIRFIDDQGVEIARLTYTHPNNAYLGETVISGLHTKAIQEKYNYGGVAEDPWLDDISGVFPHVWSWVHGIAKGISKVKHMYGVDHIEVENAPRHEAYQCIPDPYQWGAYDRINQPLRESDLSPEEAEDWLKAWRDYGF